MRSPEACATAVVEVAYARPERQRVARVPWRDGMTVQDAVDASGIVREFPELVTTSLLLGIFGRRVDPAQLVSPDDRVEIYRPLRFDPREARRQAARPAGRARSGQR